jgi:hypothetical protein
MQHFHSIRYCIHASVMMSTGAAKSTIEQLGIKAQTKRTEAEYLLNQASQDLMDKVQQSLRFADGVRAIASMPLLLPNVSGKALQSAVRASMPHIPSAQLVDPCHASNQALLNGMAAELMRAANGHTQAPPNAGM